MVAPADSPVFDGASKESAEFYQECGFCHLRTGDRTFLQLVEGCFAFYASSSLDRNVAFRNAAGIPRHVIDVFRDPRSPALQIFRHPFIAAAIDRLYPQPKCLVFTHSKLSFKAPGAAAHWFPHQDNGYKSGADLRVGFAMFLCLEDMDGSNGCLEVFPESQRLGTLQHERVIEDQATGENQLRIRSLPAHLHSLPIVAKRGDVVMFSSDMIHQSGSSSTGSRRLALIAEVEEYARCKLDDYGKAPITARGRYGGADRLLMEVKSFASPYKIWHIVRKNRRLALLVRKLRYRRERAVVK
jgi:Phytanoyl-CoA dioxygenase (PhyH)